MIPRTTKKGLLQNTQTVVILRLKAEGSPLLTENRRRWEILRCVQDDRSVFCNRPLFDYSSQVFVAV